MKENKAGFTLIELLVVVLIIGILASVALPQYQKAVERSRMAEAMQRLGDYASAQQVYYMHNNGFASAYSTLNQGDIKVPEQTEVGNWDTSDSRWSVASASGSNLEKVTMSAQRMSGIYKDCVLALSVDASGKIEKTCSGNADCCVAAQNGGYEEGQNSSSRGISPSQDRTCTNQMGSAPCSVYVLENGHTVQFQNYTWDNMGVTVGMVSEFDESGNRVYLAAYDYEGEDLVCKDSSCQGVDFCDKYPMLDLCN